MKIQYQHIVGSLFTISVIILGVLVWNRFSINFIPFIFPTILFLTLSIVIQITNQDY